MKKMYVLPLLFLVGLGYRAYSDIFIENYGGSTITNVTVSPGIHTFEVDTPFLITKHTEWYLTYSGGSPVETDSSSTQNPSYTKSFSSPGTYWIRAEVYDSDWNWEEAHRWEVDVQGGLPDLIVEDIWTEPAPIIYGETYRIFARIRNVGDAMASVTLGSQKARFLVNSVPVDMDSYDDVAPGVSVVVQTSILSVSGIPVGSHSVRVEADYYDEVDEEIETNNSRTESMDVVAPDLVVQSISIDPGYGWRPTTITAVIRNVGDAPAAFGSFDRICRFEVDGQVEYDTASFVTIPPGGTYPAEAMFTVSGVGSYAVTVVADPDNEISEELEGNNSRTESETWTASVIHDTDGDGMLDADEVIAGSEPNNVSNVWKCATVSTNSGFMITWSSISNRWYAVERTYNLTNDFVVIASNLPANPPENSYLDSATSNTFYRVEVSEEQW